MNTPFIKICDEKAFYQVFIEDLLNCKNEVVIDSPFITTKRTNTLIPIFNKLLAQNIRIYIVTRNPKEHDEDMELQAEEIISLFERLGIQAFLNNGNDHRKLAILDREILWVGSLNILSQTYSREVMLRIKGEEIVSELFKVFKIEKYLSLDLAR